VVIDPVAVEQDKRPALAEDPVEYVDIVKGADHGTDYSCLDESQYNGLTIVSQEAR
jgi:hypothetical protein